MQVLAQKADLLQELPNRPSSTRCDLQKMCIAVLLELDSCAESRLSQCLCKRNFDGLRNFASLQESALQGEFVRGRKSQPLPHDCPLK